MYGAGGSAAAGGAATLAVAGLDAFWVVVSGVAFIMAGVVLTRLRKTEEF
jgi:hypothetical protein